MLAHIYGQQELVLDAQPNEGRPSYPLHVPRNLVRRPTQLNQHGRQMNDLLKCNLYSVFLLFRAAALP